MLQDKRLYMPVLKGHGDSAKQLKIFRIEENMQMGQ